MLRSLLAGLVVLTIPFASLADPPGARSRERADTPPRARERPAAHGAAHARGRGPGPHVPSVRAFGGARPHPPRRGPRDWDERPRLAPAPRECREVSEPPQIALFLLGVGGLALLGRRSRRGRPLPLEPRRQREIG